MVVGARGVLLGVTGVPSMPGVPVLVQRADFYHTATTPTLFTIYRKMMQKCQKLALCSCYRLFVQLSIVNVETA